MSRIPMTTVAVFTVCPPCCARRARGSQGIGGECGSPQIPWLGLSPVPRRLRTRALAFLRPGSARRQLVSPTLGEALVFRFRLVARVAVSLLEQTEDLLGSALDLVEVVVRELAPLLLDLALHLGPLAFQHVLVH